MDDDTPMTLGDFETLLDQYGSNLADWPVDRREAAEDLLLQSPDAQDEMRRAIGLAQLLDLVPAPAPSAALEARVAALPQAETAHWIWMVVARPVWRPAVLAAAMLGGIYLGGAALPTSTAFGDSVFSLNSIAGGGETLGVIESLEE